MIFFLLFLLAFALVLQIGMASRGLERVTCSMRSEELLVEPGEPFTVTVTVRNRSRIPVLYLRCRFRLPLETELCAGTGGRLVTLAKTAEYRFGCFLGPRQVLEHRARLVLHHRGGYTFDSLHLAAGDFLGLREEEERFPGSCEVVVIPARPDRSREPEVLGGLLGERSVTRWIHEDPILSAGFRDYTGREPMKNIHWSRSLQSGRLMVRQMDHTAQQKVTVLLNLDCRGWVDPEPCFRLCRAVCETLEKQKLDFAFLHNGSLCTAVGLLPPLESGSGRMHLNRILEGLGRAGPRSRESLDTLIRRTLARGQDTCCYLLVTPECTDALRRAAAQLEARSGCTVRILCEEARE